MKQIRKVFIAVLTIFVALVIANPVNAQTVTLDDIAQAFNESENIKSIGDLFGWKDVSASHVEEEPNTLFISITDSEDYSSSISYELNGSVLSYEHLVESNYITAYLIADSINKVLGKKDGETLENITLFSDEYTKYTIEKEGFELKQNNSYYSAKIDIIKGVKLVDPKSYYIKPEEFDNIKEIIENETMGNQTGKNPVLAYDVIVSEDNIEIYMGEKGELGESAYKSILSVIEVVYGKKGVDYFKDKYSSFDEGAVDYDGFSLYDDYDIDDVENTIFKDTVVAKVTLDRKYFEDIALRTEYIGETIDGGKKVIELNFLNNNSYKFGVFDDISGNDIAYLIKYLFTPVIEKSNSEGNDNAIYFNVVDGKFALGTKENSIFKLVINKDDYTVELLSTKNDEKKTTLTLTFKDVMSKEYQICEYYHNDHIRYIKNDLTINITYGTEIEYKVIEGENQKVNLDNNENLTFSFDIEYENFQKEGKVYIDGKLVDSSKYVSEEGSTIIKFNKDYVKTLKAKEHTIRVEVKNGFAETKFTVVKKSNLNPATADNILFYVPLLGISISGLLVAAIYTKKRFN